MASWRDTVPVGWYVQDLSFEPHDAKIIANVLRICVVHWVMLLHTCVCVCVRRGVVCCACLCCPMRRKIVCFSSCHFTRWHTLLKLFDSVLNASYAVENAVIVTHCEYQWIVYLNSFLTSDVGPWSSPCQKHIGPHSNASLLSHTAILCFLPGQANCL